MTSKDYGNLSSVHPLKVYKRFTSLPSLRPAHGVLQDYFGEACDSQDQTKLLLFTSCRHGYKCSGICVGLHS